MKFIHGSWESTQLSITTDRLSRQVGAFSLDLIELKDKTVFLTKEDI